MIKHIVGRFLLHWIPRVLTIILIIGITIYTYVTFYDDPVIFNKIEELLFYFLPTFIMLFFFKVAWNHETTGGILLFLIASILLLVYQVKVGIAVFLSLLITGTLFLIDGYKMRYDWR